LLFIIRLCNFSFGKLSVPHAPAETCDTSLQGKEENILLCFLTFISLKKDEKKAEEAKQ